MINKDTYNRLTDKEHGYKKCASCSYRNSQYCQYCDDICEIEKQVHTCLVDLEDKIENGTLFELPFKVGDKIWRINTYSLIPRVQECTIITITIADNDRIYLEVEDEYSEFKGDNYFLTKAEAEAKLKELKEKSNVE